MKKVPEPTIRRLLNYYRCLQNGDNNLEDEYICSEALGEKAGIKSTLLRRDLSFFGHMGRKGKGYNKENLKNSLEEIIGMNQRWEIALVGAGNIGKALLRYQKFKEMGLYITEIFDNDLDKIGRRISGYIVKNVKFLKETLDDKGIQIVIIATNEEDVSDVAHQLKKTDVKAVWNLSSGQIDLGQEVVIINEDLCCSIGCLIYKLNE